MEIEKIDKISEQANTNTRLIEENAKRIEELMQRLETNTSKIEANIDKINNNSEKINQNASALDILHTSEANGKRIYRLLIIVLVMWVLTLGGTIAGFLYYINTTGFEEVTETAETTDGGNACVGDNCNNGEITYGKGDEEN